MLLTRRSIVGGIYLIVDLFMTVCAVLTHGMFLVGSGVDFRGTGIELFCSTALHLQPVLTLYFQILRVIVLLMAATFALTLLIKLTSLFAFLCCPTMKYRIQKCCLDHRYRKYRADGGHYQRYKIQSQHNNSQLANKSA